jgi:hypothetical protein
VTRELPATAASASSLTPKYLPSSPAPAFGQRGALGVDTEAWVRCPPSRSPQFLDSWEFLSCMTNSSKNVLFDAHKVAELYPIIFQAQIY